MNTNATAQSTPGAGMGEVQLAPRCDTKKAGRNTRPISECYEVLHQGISIERHLTSEQVDPVIEDAAIGLNASLDDFDVISSTCHH